MFQPSNSQSIHSLGLQSSLVLPKIPKLPFPGTRVTSPKDKLVLPRLLDGQDKTKQADPSKNQASFAKEIQDKLNLVLGEMASAGNAVEEHSDSDSDDGNFQEKINQNKEILKSQRKQKPNQVSNEVKRQQKSKPRKQKKSNNESLYDKRPKEYRDHSAGNKYIYRKKQNLKEQATIIFDDYRLQDVITHRAKEEPKPVEKQKKGSANQISMVKMESQVESQKNLLSVKKSNLFDSIQNYLENPRESKWEGNQKMGGLTLLKAKRDIEDKIKQINEKLGHSDDHEQAEGVSMKTTREWRKIEIGSKHIECRNSTFEKEIDRIGRLQERSLACLDQYLQQQKTLMDLELRRSSTLKQTDNSQ